MLIRNSFKILNRFCSAPSKISWIFTHIIFKDIINLKILWKRSSGELEHKVHSEWLSSVQRLRPLSTRPVFPTAGFHCEENIQYVPSLFEIHFKVEHTWKILKILLFFFILAADTNMIIDHQLFLQLEKRVADAEPCHNYRDNGDGPEGCWWCWNFEIYVSINNLRVITINSPTTRLDKSKDSTSARIPSNQLPSWHNECFN